MACIRLAKHYRAISNRVSFLRVFRGGGIFYRKGRGWIDILDVSDISLWKGTMSEEMSVIHRQYTEI